MTTLKRKRRWLKLLKHGASLYLKFEGLNLSIVIIFNTFHLLKNDESCSVISVALVCVSLLLRQRKVILCCCETIFLIIAELTYNFTNQIIISPIPSITEFVYSYFCSEIHSICKACEHSTHAWSYVEKHAKYFERRTHYNAWQCMSFILTLA